MPELPEVETIVRTLRPQVDGRIITNMRVLFPKTLQTGEEFLPELVGARIAAVRRRAKLAMLDLVLPDGSPLIAAFHLKMTGKFFVHPAGTEPLKHTRLIFDLAEVPADQATSVPKPTPLEPATGANGRAKPGRSPHEGVWGAVRVGKGENISHRGSTDDRRTAVALAIVPPTGSGAEPHSQPAGRLFFDDTRKFGYCRLMRPESLLQWDFWTKLGPEPLVTPAAELAVLLHSGNRAIKAALLDQTVLAGAGNIYADESLFAAGIAPTARARDIALERLTVLAEKLQAVLQKSIEECGSSIRDYRDAAGNAGAFQNSFAVYGRAGQPCVRCGKTLQSARVAGRTTVFCPHCQK